MLNFNQQIMNKLKGFKRGYDVQIVEKQLTLNGETKTHQLYEVTSKKFKGSKQFISEYHVHQFIERFEREILEQKALKAKSGPLTAGGMKVVAMDADLKASAELAGDTPVEEEELF